MKNFVIFQSESQFDFLFFILNIQDSYKSFLKETGKRGFYYISENVKEKPLDFHANDYHWYLIKEEENIYEHTSFLDVKTNCGKLVSFFIDENEKLVIFNSDKYFEEFKKGVADYFYIEEYGSEPNTTSYIATQKKDVGECKVELFKSMGLSLVLNLIGVEEFTILIEIENKAIIADFSLSIEWLLLCESFIIDKNKYLGLRK